jgi:hypothetical protein
MSVQRASSNEVRRRDAILPVTRVVAAAVIPFLVLAFLILYFRPESSGQRFAWAIASPLTAALMGAGYLSGAYFFTRVLFGRRWHRVGGAFPAVAAFTAAMLAATLLHWDTFEPSHFPFQVWFSLYILTPVVLTLLWLVNRRQDDGAPEPDDTPIPPLYGRALLLIGLLLMAGALLIFALPQTAIAAWPWPLTPLTARVVAGWAALPAVGMLTLWRERRWSAWRIPLHTLLLWLSLLLVAFVWRRDAFGPAGPVNWFTLLVLAAGLALLALLIIMEHPEKKNP